MASGMAAAWGERADDQLQAPERRRPADRRAGHRPRPKAFTCPGDQPARVRPGRIRDAPSAPARSVRNRASHPSLPHPPQCHRTRADHPGLRPSQASAPDT